MLDADNNEIGGRLSYYANNSECDSLLLLELCSTSRSIPLPERLLRSVNLCRMVGDGAVWKTLQGRR